MNQCLTGLLAAALCGSCATAFAAAPASGRVEQAAREQLLEAATNAGLNEPTVTATLVPRGTPGTCSQPTEVEALDTRHVARMRFAVVCKAEPGWRIEYVVRGSIKAKVVVARTDLEAGRPVDAQQLAQARRDVTNLADVLSDPEQAAGKKLKRAVRSGQVVSKRLLVDAILVKRGARVTVVARNVGVEVQFAGDAMQAGHRDDIIEIRNLSNGKILRARVTGENALELVADIPTSSSPQ
jgi:flagellar basal body P-ring formation protein FlgA